MEMLTCTTCKETKPVTEFYKREDFKRGYMYSCIACVSVREKERARRRKAEMDDPNSRRNAFLPIEIPDPPENTGIGMASGKMLCVSLSGIRINSDAIESTKQLPLFKVVDDASNPLLNNISDIELLRRGVHAPQRKSCSMGRKYPRNRRRCSNHNLDLGHDGDGDRSADSQSDPSAGQRD